MDLNLPFYADTEYKKAYDPKQGIRTLPFNPRNEYVPSGKFDHDTTYNTVYLG